MKGKGKVLTYWLLREESLQDHIKDGLPAEGSTQGDSRDIAMENGKRPTGWDTGGVNDAESVKIAVELFPSPDTGPDSLVDNLRGYETVEECEEIHKNVVAWRKQDHESVGATEKFHNNDRLVATANNTVQREGSKEGQSKVKKSDGRCEDVVSIVVSETEVEEECTNL